MKNKKRNILIILLIILILLAISIIIAVKTLSSNNESNKDPEIEIPDPDEGIYNNRQEIIQSQEVNGITFTNIECYWDGTNTNISYTVTNTTDQTINIGKYKIEAYDDTDTKIYSLSPYLGQDLAPGAEYKEIISTADNLSEAYSIKISLNN